MGRHSELERVYIQDENDTLSHGYECIVFPHQTNGLYYSNGYLSLNERCCIGGVQLTHPQAAYSY